MIHATRKSGMAGIATRHFSPGFCRPQRRTDLVPVGAVSFMLFSKCYITEVIIFDLIQFLLKKIIKLRFFLKKTETGSNRPVLIRFGSVFKIKTGSNRFGSVFSV